MCCYVWSTSDIISIKNFAVQNWTPLRCVEVQYYTVKTRLHIRNGEAKCEPEKNSFSICLCVLWVPLTMNMPEILVKSWKGVASYDFFWNSPIKTDAPHGVPPHLNMKSHKWKPTRPLKSEAPSRKWFLEKKPTKIRNTCFTHKTTLKKDGRNSTKTWFSPLSIQNFVIKVKRFVRKYYITWLIDLPNKLYDVEKLLISFSFYVVLLKIVVFFKKNCKQTFWIKFNLIACTLTCGCLH